MAHSASIRTASAGATAARQGQGQGQRVFVVGASGNVGPFAVQIAKSRGCHVTAVASGDKLDFVPSPDADE